MGNYATTTDLQARFASQAALAHLTDEGDAGVPTTARLDEAINHAEGFINSYCGTRYLIPLSVVDSGLAAFLKSLTLDFAVYYLVARPGSEAPASVQRSYENGLNWLKDVVSGAAVVPSAAAPASTETRSPLTRWGTGGDSESSDRLFRLKQTEAA